MTEERWLSVDEIAAHLGISKDTVYKWIPRKELPAHKVGKLWKFRISEVDKWVQGGHATDRRQSTSSNGPSSTDGGAPT